LKPTSSKVGEHGQLRGLISKRKEKAIESADRRMNIPRPGGFRRKQPITMPIVLQFPALRNIGRDWQDPPAELRYHLPQARFEAGGPSSSLACASSHARITGDGSARLCATRKGHSYRAESPLKADSAAPRSTPSFEGPIRSASRDGK